MVSDDMKPYTRDELDHIDQRNALNDLMLLAITGRTKRSGHRPEVQP